METESPGTPAHCPVMVAEALAALVPRPGGIYCDATLGAGGHAEQILLRSAPSGRLFGIDRDRTALQLATERLRPFGDRFVPVQGCFGEIADLLRSRGVDRLDGLIADLGISSMQIDSAARGFSFQQAGPIDMRMDQTAGETALGLIERLPADKLADILREYGEERYAGRIANALKRAAEAAELVDTLALAQIVQRVTPREKDAQRHKHPATRTFQALRIAVNDELRQIHALLVAAPELLSPTGRLVIIAFHSLEDRLVKHHFQKRSIWEPLYRRPLSAAESELGENPRARSARLRAAGLRSTIGVSERSRSAAPGDADADDNEETLSC